MVKSNSTVKDRTEPQDEQKTPDDELTICRRRAARREGDGAVPEADSQPAEPIYPTTRRKVQRRRQIDPTTCERDYTDDEIEFMQAMDAYKRTSGRMFPTCSEVLEVLRDLGYQKITEGEEMFEDVTAAPDIEHVTDEADDLADTGPAVDAHGAT